MNLSNKKLLSLHLPRYCEFPAFELYIDQVINFVSESLTFFNLSSEPIITASMINNYVKNGVLPPPEKKKYNRDHLAKLIVICIGKRMLPLSNLSEAIALMSRVFEISEGYDIFCDEVEYEIKSTLSPEEFPARTLASAESSRVATLRSLASAVAKILIFDCFMDRRRRLGDVAKKLSGSEL